MTDEAKTLAACPCGVVPLQLSICPEGSGKWARVCGDCCGEWEIEFRLNYCAPTFPEGIELAQLAWNSAPRAQAVKEAV